MRLGNWPTADEARRLWQAPTQRRSKAHVTGRSSPLCVDAGSAGGSWLIWRQESEEHRAIVDLVGKGGHSRTVPIPGWVKNTLDLSVAAAELSGGRVSDVSVAPKNIGRNGYRTAGLASSEQYAARPAGSPRMI